MRRSSVVLPQPEGPRRVKSSPSSMSKLARETTSSFPKRLVRPRAAIRMKAARPQYFFLSWSATASISLRYLSFTAS